MASVEQAQGPMHERGAAPGVPGATADSSLAPAPGEGAEADDAPHSSLGAQLAVVGRALAASRAAKAVMGLTAAVFIVIVATAYWQIRLNSWNKPFFDALSRRDMPGFLVQLGTFFIIIATLLVLNVAQRWLVETLKIKLREGLVQDLVEAWMQPRRAFWLANAGAIGVNPDQRMHEDARKLCELSADLGAGLLQASILVVTFAGVLWVLSQDFSLRIADHDYAIPGFMLWAAIAYAGVGSLLSYRVGHSLIRRNAERYAREAELRFSLVRINEHLDGISLAGGEADERRRVELDLADVLAATARLVTGLTNLTWVTAGFGWITTVVPILVAAPLYFNGKISFGGLMMAASAFTQAQSSLRWFVDNFSVIADWRATLLRVANFRTALMRSDVQPDFDSRIDYDEGPAGALTIDALHITSSAGVDALQETPVTVHAGERVLIVGAPGTGKSLLFRALAGLWPWGSGRITRPAGEAIFYVPRGTPYLPRGTLREVLAYPHPLERFEAQDCARALGLLGLERLVPLLEQTRRWDREMSQDEQLNLAFARVALHAPAWVLIDDTFGTLDEEALSRVVDVFTGELAHTAVIHVGRAERVRARLFPRVLHLVKAAPGAEPSVAAGVMNPAAAAAPPAAPGAEDDARAGRAGAAAPAAAGPAVPTRLIAGLLALLLLWPALAPTPVRAQELEFRLPAGAREEHLAAAMRDLAQRVLPVYQENQTERYLDRLSALQLVAGDLEAADASRQSLAVRRRSAAAARPPAGAGILDVYVHARALQAREHLSFERAFVQAYRAALQPLSDRDAYAITGWSPPDLPHLESLLQGGLEAGRTAASISVTQAARLVHTYFAVEAMRRFGPYVEALAAEDDRRRYLVEERAMIRTSDGTRIRAIVVRPRAAAGPLPALLEFTIQADARNLARECAAYGYAGVVAYARGRGGSSGTVLPFEHDGADGQAVVEWIARQPWSDGRVALYGDGYSGFAAWAVAKRTPAALKAIATADPIAPGIDFPMEGNIFHNDAYRWLVQVGADRSAPGAGADRARVSPANEPGRWQALLAAWYRNGDPCSDLDGLFGWPSPTLHRWLDHPAYDAYWQALIPTGEQFARIEVPVLTVAGYYAAAQAGALHYFEEHARYLPHADHTLVLGPYAQGWTRRERAVELDPEDIDPAADLDLRALRYAWFDSVLRGAARPPLLQQRVNYEVMGADAWRHAASVAEMADGSVRFYLDPAANGGVHLLAAAPAGDTSFVRHRVDLSDRRAGSGSGGGGGSLLLRTLPAGNAVVYASEPLAQAMELSGAIAGRFDIVTNKRDVDLSLALYEQLPDGQYRALFDPPVEFRASYLADRSHRHLLHPGERQTLELRSPRLTARRVQAHNRLVLVLAVNQRPDQEINYGTGADVRQEFIENAGPPVDIRWFADSYIDLPVRSQAGKTTQP